MEESRGVGVRKSTTRSRRKNMPYPKPKKKKPRKRHRGTSGLLKKREKKVVKSDPEKGTEQKKEAGKRTPLESYCSRERCLLRRMEKKGENPLWVKSFGKIEIKKREEARTH